MKFADTPRSSGTHPLLEDLAAFADGSLSASDRQRLIRHFAECQDCYEVFTGTLQTLLEGAGAPASQSGASVLPAVSRFRRSLPVAIPLAAAAAAAILIFLLPTLRPSVPERVSVAEIVIPLAPDPVVASQVRSHLDAHGFPVQRGTGDAVGSPLAARSFRLGIRATELEAALRSGDRETALRLTYRIEDELGSLTEGAYALALYAGREGVRGALDATTPEELLELTDRADRELQEVLSPDQYLLGRWIGAAEIAAATGRLDRWADSDNLRLLDRLIDSKLSPPVRRDLGELRARLKEGEAEDSDVSKLLRKIRLGASSASASPYPS